MTENDRQELSGSRWTLPAVLLLTAILAVTPVIDQRAGTNLDSLFQRALVTFALARTLNGVISAVQGTELALQPAGVGVTLTPGQILDPVNDLVERFSWIMLGATVSLGIQQVLLEFSAWWAVKALVVVLALWLGMLCLTRRRGGRTLLVRGLLLALFLRFAVPLTMIANDAMYQVFLAPRYVNSSEVINHAEAGIQALGPEQDMRDADNQEGGWLDSISRAWRDTSDTLDLRTRLQGIQKQATDMIDHLIQLSVVFVLQTGILPIAFLWLFLQLGRWIFRPIKP